MQRTVGEGFEIKMTLAVTPKCRGQWNSGAVPHLNREASDSLPNTEESGTGTEDTGAILSKTQDCGATSDSKSRAYRIRVSKCRTKSPGALM